MARKGVCIAGRACIARGMYGWGLCMAGGMHGWFGVWLKRACMARGAARLGNLPPSPTLVGKPVVRILLEF